MRKCIYKLLLVSLPIMTLLIGVELIARNIPATYSTKLVNFEKKKNQIEILVLGSSHSNFGINPQYFEKEGYNLSNTSQCLYQDYKVILKYLPLCKNVKLVIIPISYFTLQSDLAKSPEAWRAAYYSYYMGVYADDSQSAFDLKNYSAMILWDGPLKVIKAARHNNKLNINEFGYQTPEEIRTDIRTIINDASGKERVAYHHKFMDSSLTELNLKVLNNLLQELASRNVKVIFVTPPVYETYSKFTTKENYALMADTINTITRKYSSSYYNYFTDDRFNIEDFWDNDHLNAKGARKFSEILEEEVIKSNLASPFIPSRN